jgi:hypothetical protein
MSKRYWSVTLRYTETEGQNTTRPWYLHEDVEKLIRTILGRSNDPRDLELLTIEAKCDD